MDDTGVDFFLDTLKQLITSSDLDLTINEKHQLEFLQEKIEYLRGFLKVTEKKRNEHSEVTKLVMQIREVVSEAGNIIRQFVVDSVESDASDSIREHQDHLSLNLESVKKDIKTLTAEVKQIYDENLYDLNGVAAQKLKHSSTGSGGIGGSGSSRGRHTSKSGEEKVVVGFEKDVETLIQRLDNKGVGLEIISIIGAAGGGKTTLAREVFEHPFTLHTFEIRAWVNISQDYDKTMKRELLIDILKSASPEILQKYEKSSEDFLGEKVHKCLKGRTYLIVMDDVWGIEVWNDIQKSFPKEYKGSKVLFTSRLVVQLDSVSCIPHYLPPLPNDCSWKLLKNKVFGMKGCPQKLVCIGEQIAGKCEGLPLAIVAIAGILATEDKTLHVWKEVSKSLSSIIANKNQEGCMDILQLSYNHLPLHLKKCFVYIGGFPEDYEISGRELIWLWVAKGFIQQSQEERSLEVVAKDYLINLIDRNLVMVARKSSLGGIKACHIHDLLRVLCLKKAKEDKSLVQIYRKGDSFSPFDINKHREIFFGRELFQKFRSEGKSLVQIYRKGVSPFDINRHRPKVLAAIIQFLTELLAITLCLSNAPIDRNYRLGIRLPHDIFKMVELRHLHDKNGVFKYHFSHLSSKEAARISFDNSSKLDSLQTLHRICTCMDCRSFLVRTPNLRKLGFLGELISRDNVLMLPDLEFLKCLEKLSFTNIRPTGIRGSSTIREGLKLPQTITQLTLNGTLLKWEELSILQTLLSLEVLKLLKDACSGRVWNANELEGFFQLKYLRFESLNIVEWNASENQFPRLEVLVLEKCFTLKRIPIDFGNLTDLRKIKLGWCTRSVEDSAREIQEEQKNKKGDDDCLHLLSGHLISWKMTNGLLAITSFFIPLVFSPPAAYFLAAARSLLRISPYIVILLLSYISKLTVSEFIVKLIGLFCLEVLAWVHRKILHSDFSQGQIIVLGKLI